MSIDVAEFEQRLIEHRSQVRPVGLRSRGARILHGEDFLFAIVTPVFPAAGALGDETGRSIRLTQYPCRIECEVGDVAAWVKAAGAPLHSAGREWLDDLRSPQKP